MSGSTTPRPNPNVPDIPTPIADLAALASCIYQLRTGIRSLAGLAGKPTDRAVTFNDLPTPMMTDTATRTTSLENRMTALEARVTAIEEFIATLPPPP